MSLEDRVVEVLKRYGLVRDGSPAHRPAYQLGQASVKGGGQVTTAKIQDGAVTAVKLATDAVETAKIKALNVTAAKLAADAVETAKIKALNVTAAKLADDALGGFLAAQRSGKRFEGIFRGGTTDEYGENAVVSGIFPRFVAGRIDGGASYWPSGTVFRVLLSVMFRNATGAATSLQPFLQHQTSTNWGVRAYGQSHATQPNDVELFYVRDSDGTTQLAALTDWANGEVRAVEVEFTLGADSATASHRVAGIVVRENGTDAATVAGARILAAGANDVLLNLIGLTEGATVPGARPLAPAMYQVVLP